VGPRARRDKQQCGYNEGKAHRSFSSLPVISSIKDPTPVAS
jgi:hypothetical protein